MTPSGVRRVERILKVFKAETGANVTAVIDDVDLPSDNDDEDQDGREGQNGSPSLMSISTTFLNETDSSTDNNQFNQSSDYSFN